MRPFTGAEYLLSCTMTCQTPSSVQEPSTADTWKCLSFHLVLVLRAFCISASLVSDLVKCSRTAARHELLQLINNSDNMIYAVRSAHKIAVCNCLPNVFHACSRFFFFIYLFVVCKTKLKTSQKSEFITEETAHLSSWS